MIISDIYEKFRVLKSKKYSDQYEKAMGLLEKVKTNIIDDNHQVVYGYQCSISDTEKWGIETKRIIPSRYIFDFDNMPFDAWHPLSPSEEQIKLFRHRLNVLRKIIEDVNDSLSISTRINRDEFLKEKAL